jgi:hypothetical protein
VLPVFWSVAVGAVIAVGTGYYYPPYVYHPAYGYPVYHAYPTTYGYSRPITPPPAPMAFLKLPMALTEALQLEVLRTILIPERRLIRLRPTLRMEARKLAQLTIPTRACLPPPNRVPTDTVFGEVPRQFQRMARAPTRSIRWLGRQWRRRTQTVMLPHRPRGIRRKTCALGRIALRQLSCSEKQRSKVVLAQHSLQLPECKERHKGAKYHYAAGKQLLDAYVMDCFRDAFPSYQ